MESRSKAVGPHESESSADVANSLNKSELISNLPSITDTGANASAEEAEEGLEDAEVKVNNIVHSFRLQSTSFDKKGYLSYLKGEWHLSFWHIDIC
jgi:hypothetical protein